MSRDCLSGVRVIEFTLAAAGPLAGEFMGFLGAEVIKVETRTRLDQERRGSRMIVRGEDGKLRDVSRPIPGPDAAPGFNCFNLDKLSITVDMTKPQGLPLIKELVKVSDVVLSNFRPGVMNKLGLGYEELKKIRPDIIVITSSAVGATGPDWNLPGYASIFGAVGGLSHLTGYPDGAPKEMRVPMDSFTGASSALALLAALNYRQQTGKGQSIDVSSAEAISVLIGDAMMDYSMNKRSLSRQGNEDDIMAPHNCYRCQGEDEWVTIAVGAQEEWEALCKVIGEPDLARDERFADAYVRWQHRKELDAIIEGWTRGHNKFEIMVALQKAEVAAVPTYNAKDLYEDPHLRERSAYAVSEHPVLGPQTVLAPPWKLSATPARVHHAAPLLGGANSYVLCELLGMSQSAFEELEVQQVLN
ncbi:MAG: CoA transferase [Chloroflexi bacterium]|nr:CoA transferase [Chloroflexota bacterium]